MKKIISLIGISKTHTFVPFIWLHEMAIFPKVHQPDNVESHNSLKRILEVFVLILLEVNLSFNQTLLTFLLYVKQSRKTQLILAISL